MKSDIQENEHQYFASCPKYLEALLKDELDKLGCADLRETVAGVYFNAELKTLYSVCLWSRIANRILQPIVRQTVDSAETLYNLAYECEWENYFTNEKTFLVDFNGTNDAIRHTQFGAQKIKDAVVDRFNAKVGERPSVEKNSPDIRLNAHLSKNRLTLSIDISGESLHKRAYRGGHGLAPLKENLAAALLIRAGWPEMIEQAKKNQEKLSLIDPMCGSGTLISEGALMASNTAPGLLRTKYAFKHLSNFNEALWDEVFEEAQAAITSYDNILFYGYDSEAAMLNFARDNLRRAAPEIQCELMHQPLAEFKRPQEVAETKGLLICNPPYGERLGEVEALKADYQMLGRLAKQELGGWQVAVFTSNPDLGREMRLRPRNRYKFFNGPIEAQLLMFDILSGEGKLREDMDLKEKPLSEGAQMLANRLLKNKRKLESWLKGNSIGCYRLYDADMPEYSAAIDVYENYFHIQEYQAPKSINTSDAQRRFRDIIHACTKTFNVPEGHLFSKTRQRQKGSFQYRKNEEDRQRQSFVVTEGNAKFYINLKDYLDSGLFLDHRPLRKLIHEQSNGKSFLNLFCYTGSATVQAALGGASRSVSVDMSNTYLDWASDNFHLNNISTQRHKLCRDDAVKWLRKCREGFDLIMLDPPSFSNSKNTDTILDIQKDHVLLIERCVELLTPGGVLYFSNNLQSFKLAEDELENMVIENITERTLDKDFQRNQKIHQCWKITAG